MLVVEIERPVFRTGSSSESVVDLYGMGGGRMESDENQEPEKCSHKKKRGTSVTNKEWRGFWKEMESQHSGPGCASNLVLLVLAVWGRSSPENPVQVFGTCRVSRVACMGPYSYETNCMYLVPSSHAP
jgi:hypothetical protein